MALFLFLAWAAVHATDSRAQRPTFREEWAAGVTGGINYSTVFFAPKVHQSPMQGFNAGVPSGGSQSVPSGYSSRPASVSLVGASASTSSPSIATSAA